jgi:phosphoribosylanthranilate isomerase
MPTRVKICGLTRLEDAQRAAELGAAALGFNFYPLSPRYIDPAAAREMVRRLPPLVTTVGVFANETDAGNVLSVARRAGVSAVQVHGPAYPALHELLCVFPLLVAVAVREGFKSEELGRFEPSAYLLDAFDPDRLGGTGRTFDWKAARHAKQWGTIILAGGLTPANVAQAVREVRPFAVDVASGVESAPGIKDSAKLQAFFRAVAEADEECSPEAGHLEMP